MDRILRLYTDRSYVNPNTGHLPLLYPFWGNCDNHSQTDKGRFDEWTKNGIDYVSLVPIMHCDAVLFPCGLRSRFTNPVDWNRDLSNALELASMAKMYGKRMLIFFNNDSDEDIPVSNAIIFRTSFYRSKRKENEFSLPAWAVDFKDKYSHFCFSDREKRQIPTVGYAGYIDYRNSFEYFKFITRRLRHPGDHRVGSLLRGCAIRRMLKSPKINTNFIIRNRCLTGISDVSTREEYVKCIIDSDYSLVVRGGGNFSYRLYEVLSCGRIPIFIDTDCVLPFDDIIDWKKICVWVDKKSVNEIDTIVSDFHTLLSNDSFLQMQKQARFIYEEWISPTGFYKNLWRYI